MMDFTIEKYSLLLKALHEAGYNSVLRFKDTMERQVMLRHDVDIRPKNSLVIILGQLERVGMRALSERLRRWDMK